MNGMSVELRIRRTEDVLRKTDNPIARTLLLSSLRDLKRQKKLKDDYDVAEKAFENYKERVK